MGRLHRRRIAPEKSGAEVCAQLWGFTGSGLWTDSVQGVGAGRIRPLDPETRPLKEMFLLALSLLERKSRTNLSCKPFAVP